MPKHHRDSYDEDLVVAITCGGAATDLEGVTMGSSRAPALVSIWRIDARAQARLA
jgi:hypothetical protein